MEIEIILGSKMTLLGIMSHWQTGWGPRPDCSPCQYCITVFGGLRL